MQESIGIPELSTSPIANNEEYDFDNNDVGDNTNMIPDNTEVINFKYSQIYRAILTTEIIHIK